MSAGDLPIPVTCWTCGSPCHVQGNTTKYYAPLVPDATELRERAERAEAEVARLKDAFAGMWLIIQAAEQLVDEIMADNRTDEEQATLVRVVCAYRQRTSTATSKEE